MNKNKKGEKIIAEEKYKKQITKKIIRYIDIKNFSLNTKLNYLYLIDNKYGQAVKVYKKEVFFSGIRVANGFKRIGEGIDWIIRTRNRIIGKK